MSSFRIFRFALLLAFAPWTFSVVHAQESPSSAVDTDSSLSAAGIIIRDSNPSTPAELITAINQLIAFGDLGLAKKYAKPLGEQNDPQNTQNLLAIGDSLGPVPIFRIANNAELDSSARNFCKNILKAMRGRDTDPNRLNALAQIAVGNDQQSRRDALLKMRAAGTPAVEPLLKILLTGSPAEQLSVKKGLIFLGAPAVSPLLAVLETDNEKLRNNIASILTQIADPAAVNDIRITTLASQDIDKKKSMSGQIQKSIRNYLLGRQVFSTALGENGENGEQHTLWEWDDKQSALSQRKGSQSLLAAQAAYRIASALSREYSEDENILFEAAALLQYEKLNKGLDQPLDLKTLMQTSKRKEKQGEHFNDLEFLEAVFEFALDQGYVPAATGAAEVFGKKDITGGQGINLLARRGATTHPLVTAVNHQDRRLRLAACNAILALSDAHPFVGTSVVSDALRFLAASQGKPRVFIVDRRVNRRQSLGSMLKKAGYVANIYKSGRTAMAAAQRQPDYIAGFISFTIGPRGIKDVLHEFRTDSRTAGLPIGILVDPRNENEAENMVADDPLSTILFMPVNAEMAGKDMDKLKQMASDSFVNEAERLQQAQKALCLFKKFMEQSPDSYEPTEWIPLLTKSLETEQLAVHAIDILTGLKTPAAQQTLVDTASNPYLPLATRQIAASAFAQSIAKHGIGLSKVAIQRQQERYDATKGKSPEEEAIHWSILQSLNQAADKGRN